MYFISEQYNARLDAKQDFEGENKVQDDYQNEVYATARELADKFGYRTVLDFGSGGGFKLLKFFEEFDTTGVDLPDGVALLRKKYPERKWVTQDEVTLDAVDLVICSDVIEHVVDPDALCEFIIKLKPKHAVISTPDRALICYVYWQPEDGPPRNMTHVREWSFEEFGKYMDSHFKVENLFYSNRDQYTMCAVVGLK